MKRLLFLAPIFLLANDEIKEIKYIGLEHISPITANSISLIHKGDELDLEKVNKSIKKFYEYGYFKDIIVDYDKGILTYKFIEKPAILKIEYKNVSEDLKELLKDKLKRGMIFDEDKLEEIRDFIVSYYDAKGEFNSVVIFDIKKQKNGVIIVINVNKGENIIINKIHFYGVKKESIDDIKSEIDNKNRDILGWLPFRNSGKFELRALLTDKDKIRNFYLSKGYLDVKVSNPLFIANFDNNKAEISYKIFEGNRYKVGSVGIDIDNKNLLDIKTDELHLKSGLYFNINRLKKDIEFLKTKLADKGYAYVKVYPQIKKHNGIVDVIYKIIPGEKVYISDVVIEGNTKTLDRVIRRSVYLTPGYLYSLTDKQDTIRALKRSGYFEDVELKEIPIDANHMKILVKVKEGLTGSLKAGISYNSYSKFGVDFSISERNIFGSGQTLNAKFSTTSKSTSYSLNLLNPRVLDSEYSLGVSLYKTKFDALNYTSDKTGFSLTSGKQITRNVKGSITYGYEKVNLSNVTDDLDYKENSIKSYIMPSVSYDTTDDYFFPQNGIRLYGSLEYAGIGGDQKFIKAIQSGKFFYSLENNYDITTILKYKIKMGEIKQNGYLPLNEKFYLGGLGSVRGYNYSSISPKNSNGDEIGGKLMMINSIEISMPVSLKKKMWLSGFIDNGKIGEDSLDISRSSYGVSFDWITPVGPLNFTWAWAINPKPDDDLRKFEFSIGTGF